MANELVALGEIEKMAKYAVESQLFGVKTVPQAVSLMLLCQAKGMHPMEAVEEYHVIQGRQTMKVERMMAKFQAAGGKVAWSELSDQRAQATFSHPSGGAVTISWDLEMAKRAGLAGKDNWRNYPRAMLRSRVVSEGIKSVFPGAASGSMTPEEAADIGPPVTAPERDITPPPASGVAAVQARLAKIAPAATVDAETIPDPTLLDLREQAMLGTGALRAAWDRLPKPHQDKLRGELAQLKAAAAEADAAQTESEAA